MWPRVFVVGCVCLIVGTIVMDTYIYYLGIMSDGDTVETIEGTDNGVSKENVRYMAIDQYGNTYHGLKHPRKDLLEKLCMRHADKMYVDKLDGSSKHIGYIIAGHWLTVYKVTPMERDA